MWFIPLSDLTTIGTNFAPTSVHSKIFNTHFQRTYAMKSNSAWKTVPGGTDTHILRHSLWIIKSLHRYLTQQNESHGITWRPIAMRRERVLNISKSHHHGQDELSTSITNECCTGCGLGCLGFHYWLCHSCTLWQYWNPRQPGPHLVRHSLLMLVQSSSWPWWCDLLRLRTLSRLIAIGRQVTPWFLFCCVRYLWRLFMIHNEWRRICVSVSPGPVFHAEFDSVAYMRWNGYWTYGADWRTFY